MTTQNNLLDGNIDDLLIEVKMFGSTVELNKEKFINMYMGEVNSLAQQVYRLTDGWNLTSEDEARASNMLDDARANIKKVAEMIFDREAGLSYDSPISIKHRATRT
jgi:ferritin-like protein